MRLSTGFVIGNILSVSVNMRGVRSKELAWNTVPPKTGRVDSDVVKENDAQRQYWWEVLKESLLSGRGALLSGR